jgi:HlyD family secretion protein
LLTREEEERRLTQNSSGSKRPWIYLILAVIVVLLFFIVRSRGKGAKTAAGGSTTVVAAKPNPPTPVVMAKATTGTVTQAVEVSGDVAALTQVTLASKITARIVSVNAREGDRVRKGQLIVQLDTSDLDSQVRSARDAVAAANARLDQAKVAYRLQVQSSQVGINTAKENLRAAQARLQLTKEGARTQERLQAQSAVNVAQANLEDAQTNYNRSSRLYKEGAIAKAEVDSSETRLKVARANLASAQQQYSLVQEGARPQEIEQDETAVATAQQQLNQAYDNQRQNLIKLQDVQAAEAAVRQSKASLALAQQNRDNAFIRSSVNGVVAKRSAEPGQVATVGSALMTITVPGTVYFSAGVSETDVERVHAGQSVMIQIDAFPNEIFNGKVDRVYPTGDPSSRTFIARITLSDAGGKLRPGMFARGAIIVSRIANATLIPKSALTAAGESVPLAAPASPEGVPASVFTVKDGKTAKKEIHVGAPSGNYVQVISGLEPGDPVVSSGSNLEEGQNVDVTH